uniref:Uncharacterized protein n=1 Tax=Anopheles culicifacies TaxID=139723 RepID=A0A182MLN4_9DIPT
MRFSDASSIHLRAKALYRVSQLVTLKFHTFQAELQLLIFKRILTGGLHLLSQCIHLQLLALLFSPQNGGFFRNVLHLIAYFLVLGVYLTQFRFFLANLLQCRSKLCILPLHIVSLLVEPAEFLLHLFHLVAQFFLLLHKIFVQLVASGQLNLQILHLLHLLLQLYLQLLYLLVLFSHYPI